MTVIYVAIPGFPNQNVTFISYFSGVISPTHSSRLWLITLKKDTAFRKFSNLYSAQGTVFWVVMLCGLEKGQHFGGTYHTHLQGQRVGQASDQWKQTAS
jgi:hypothetical protein